MRRLLGFHCLWVFLIRSTLFLFLVIFLRCTSIWPQYFYFFIVLTVYILTVCSNATILYLIWIHKNLHEPMYIFIAALLFNGLLYSTNIYPKLLIDFLSEKPIISYSACLLQFFMFYSFGGSEFLLLAAMAFDRYVAICKPLRYRNIMRRSTVTKLCTFNLEGIFCNNTIYSLQCVRSTTLALFCMDSRAPYITYGAFIALNTIVLPLAFILFTYTKILIISLRGSGDTRRKAARTCSPHLLVLVSFSCLCSYDVVAARLEVDLDRTARFVMTLQVVLYHPLFNPIIYGLKMGEIRRKCPNSKEAGKETRDIRTAPAYCR
uniref:Olfactory receptor n=1 Tax=Xiphophorus maculatus TaxID=8083 RepID=M4A238_XIPMA